MLAFGHLNCLVPWVCARPSMCLSRADCTNRFHGHQLLAQHVQLALLLPGGPSSATAHASSAPPAARLGGGAVGDALTVFAALSYSLATVRLGSYTREVAPLPLALATSVTLAAVSVALLLGNAGVLLLQGAGGASALAQLWPNCWEPQAWGVIVYLAAGPGALATFLQVKAS